MKRRSTRWLWTAPLTLLGGCLLPTFEDVPASVGEGGSDNGGSAPTLAGAAGEAPQTDAGASAGGNASPSRPTPKAAPDQYVVQQGKTLTVAAADGVLSNDSPRNLKVGAFSDTDKARPKAFNADVTISADGSITFKPAAAFFGRYLVQYTVANDQGHTATSTATFVVQPTTATLLPVTQGIGGVALTGGAKDGLGSALTALGDVNGDGFDDFAVGASGAAGGYGSIYIVFGAADFGALTLGALAASSAETRFAVLVGSADAPISDYVASAGKFNSDKTLDIVVGSPDSDTGRVFVVYGGADLKTSLTLSTMPDARGVTFSGSDQGGRFGLHVSGGGDYNGDKKTDLLAGIYPGGLTTGGVCLVLANPVKSQALSQVKNVVVPDSGVFELPRSLTFAGDVTGDGKDDVLASSAHHVALLFGQGDNTVPTDISTVAAENLGLLRQREPSATGVATVAAAGDVNGDKHADFAYCDQFTNQARCDVFFGPRALGDSLGSPDWQLGGFVGSPTLPLLAQGADLNQDGFSDFVLADQKSVYVVFGREAGFGAVDVGSLGSDGFALTAPNAGKLATVATIGDVNGDGYGDFAVGEPTASGGVGLVYVVFGGPYSADQR